MVDRPSQRPTLVNRPVVPRPSSSSSSPSSSPSPSASSLPTVALPEGRVIRHPQAMVIERPGGATTTFSLMAGERYVLGRHDSADVAFDDDAVSRLHGVLSFHEGEWRFEDYGSANGSSVTHAGVKSECRPHESVVVGIADVVELGHGESRVRFIAQRPAAASLPTESSEVSHAAKSFAEKLRLASRTRVPVFLLGVSGVGKTWSARRIHEMSQLPGAFVPINCARLPQEPTSLHSELLGHVRGAYTGAEAARTGKLVQADGGTLFLDEVESLPAIAQGFLLDVLEGSGDLAPLGAGAVRLKPLAFRLVSASKAPLLQSKLRGDLCERLAEGHLWRVPGLDERAADIPGLLHQFAGDQSTLLGVPVVLTPAAIRFAQAAHWPGQIRMLRAAVTALAQLALARRLERGAKAAGIEISDQDLQSHLDERSDVFGETGATPTRGDARRLTRQQIEAAVDAAGGNQVKAAQKLGIARNTLRRRLAEDD